MITLTTISLCKFDQKFFPSLLFHQLKQISNVRNCLLESVFIFKAIHSYFLEYQNHAGKFPFHV